MLKTRLLPIATCCLGLALLISSTGWFGKSSAVDTEVNTEAKADSGNSTTAVDAPASFFDEPLIPAAPLASDRRELRIGERFSYLKTVEQRITQDHAQASATGNSRLTIGLSLEVADVVGNDAVPAGHLERHPGDRLFSVRYRNVKFVQDIPGQEVNYDSNNPDGPVPPQAEAYRGLPGQGFSFWLDRRNQLRSLVGFQDFLQNCLQHAAPQQRMLVWKSLAGTSESDHLANFIDDGIGLLPLDAIEPGASWQRERRIQQPVPITMQLQYTIEESAETMVDVAVGGTVVPQAAQDVGLAQLRILGGRISGRCSIDRRTGLPQNCRVEQVVEMIVQLPDGTSIPQTKQTITQLTAVPDSETPRVRIPYAGVEKDSRLR